MVEIEKGTIKDIENEDHIFTFEEDPLEEEEIEKTATTQQLIDACEQCIEHLENENTIENLKKATVLLLKIIAVELNNKIEYDIQEKYYT